MNRLSTTGTLVIIGLTFAALWVVCVRFIHQSAIEASRVQAESRLKLIGSTAAELLMQDRLTSVRRLVIEAASEFKLTRCRVILPSGEVVADGTPALISIPSLPATWLDQGHRFPSNEIPGLYATQIQIPDRGWIQLETLAADGATDVSLWPIHAGFGICAFILLMVSWFALRRSQHRLRGAEEVRRALAMLDQGETELSILQISESLGTEVRAWNGLLRGLELDRRQSIERPQRSGSARDEQLFAACDTLPSGLLVIDAAGRIRYSNGAARMMMRLGAEDVAGGSLKELVTDARLIAAVDDAISGARRRSTVDVEHTEEGNTSLFRIGVRPLRSDDGGGAVITIDDVTQARTADKARDTFIAQATHELRTPLTNIKLYTDAAIDAGDDAAARSNALNVINNECRRLERIVGDMLSVSEIEAGSFEITVGDVRLDALFNQLQKDFAQQAQAKQIKLSFHLPPKLPVARADRDKVVIAIQNLLGNAIKYTPAGGRVDVSVESTEQMLSIAVQDTGIGIDAAQLPRLFERFFRADDPRVKEISGTGLGLTLSREVIRLHGGDIVVDSVLDKGSTFTLTLPLAAEVPQAC